MLAGVAPFRLVESKLVVPSARPGIVARRGLIDLVDAHDCPVVAVVAPPGYGKSTLLAQWAHRRQPRVGWLSVDAWDNDPAVLLTYLAAALARIEAVDPLLTGRMSPGAGIVKRRRVPPGATVVKASAMTSLFPGQTSTKSKPSPPEIRRAPSASVSLETSIVSAAPEAFAITRRDATPSAPTMPDAPRRAA